MKTKEKMIYEFMVSISSNSEMYNTYMKQENSTFGEMVYFYAETLAEEFLLNINQE